MTTHCGSRVSGEKKNEEEAKNLSNFESPVEVLIFKQGISLGWDCPRAQILVAFREMKSEIFSLQTLGRIMRTPEHKHYNNPERPELDLSFVYSNLPKTEHIQRPAGTPPIIRKMTRRFPPVTLKGSYASRAGTYNDLRAKELTAHLSSDTNATHLYERMASDPRIHSLAPSSRIAVGQLITLQEVDAGVVQDNENTTLTVANSEAVTEAKVDELLAEMVGGTFPNKRRSIPALKTSLYRWLESLWAGSPRDKRVESVQKLLLDNDYQLPIKQVVKSAILRCAEADEARQKEKSREEFPYTTPDVLVWNADNTTEIPPGPLAEKYLYADANGTSHRTSKTSQPEKEFVRQLADWDRENRITWWWKNDVGRRDFFSLAYQNSDGAWATTYPDFLVQLTDGRLGIFEVKDESVGQGTSSDHEARRKAVALHEWQPENCIAGVVYQEGSIWMLASTLSTRDDKDLETFFLPSEQSPQRR